MLICETCTYITHRISVPSNMFLWISLAVINALDLGTLVRLLLV
jgi:hypothetical protein